MREWLAKLTPAPWLSKKLLMAAVLVGVGIGAYCWGRHYANANQPNGRNGQGDSAIPKGYGTRIVAYVYNQPVFREELGEYLIARMGAERLDFMINRKIVEAECRKQNVIVTDADVETRFIRDIASFGPGMSVVAFEQNVLRRFGKTVYEWKEDVIRPKLQMEELVRRKVTITEKDVKEGFEARYGPKVECRMIVFDKDDRSTADRVWKEISKGRDAFIARAKTQALPNLASIEGRVPPIHKHFGDQNIEDAAFRLKPGEVSGLIKMADHNMVVLLCESHIPPTLNVKFQNEYAKIAKEMEEQRVTEKIPEEFKKMRELANPQKMLQQEASSATSRPELHMPKLQAPGGPVRMPDAVPQGPVSGLQAPTEGKK